MWLGSQGATWLAGGACLRGAQDGTSCLHLPPLLSSLSPWKISSLAFDYIYIKTSESMLCSLVPCSRAGVRAPLPPTLQAQVRLIALQHRLHLLHCSESHGGFTAPTTRRRVCCVFCTERRVLSATHVPLRVWGSLLIDSSVAPGGCEGISSKNSP